MAHETASSGVESILTGLDQLDPSNVSARPASSTATQKLVEPHDTSNTEPLDAILTGLDQSIPSNLSALPESSTATQKLAEAQEIESRVREGSISNGLLQLRLAPLLPNGFDLARGESCR
ncbi:MAG TPA: hypothetical protein VKU92_13340 [Acidimicrobiales bacterium]|nr:hypothetical protein [Acidimicrobiales bacterium]